MELDFDGTGPTAPFLGTRDLFRTEHDLEWPVTIRMREDPDERKCVSHDADNHRLTIYRQAVTSAIARELALHEFAYMHHAEVDPLTTPSTEERLFLSLSGRTIERRTLTQCYRIANHTRDIYADDIWLNVALADKLVTFSKRVWLQRWQIVPKAGLPGIDSPTAHTRISPRSTPGLHSR